MWGKNLKSYSNISMPQNLWYDIAFIMWFGGELIFKSTLETINDIPLSYYEERVTYIVTFMLIFQVFFLQKYTKRDIFIITGITVIVLLATYNSGAQYLAAAWLFIMASKNCHLKNMTKIAFWVLTLGILLVLTMYKVGIITETIVYRHGMIRHSFGFSHPNQLALRIFQWILCFSYTYWENFGIFHFSVVCIVGYWMHSVTDSQTATVCAVAFIIMTIIIKRLEKRKDKYIAYVGVMLRIGSVIIGVLSVGLTYIDVRTVPLLSIIDRIISNRFFWTHKVYKRVGNSLLGKKFSIGAVMNGMIQIRRGMYFDNGYANLWLRFGIIVLICFLTGYYILMKKSANNKLLTVILFIYSIYGIMEAGFVQLTHNIFLLALAQVIYSDNAYLNEQKRENRKIVFRM